MTLVIAGVVRTTSAVGPLLIILGLALWGARALRQPAAAALRRRRDLPELSGQRRRRDCAVDRLLPLGSWRQAWMLPTTPEAITIPAEVPAHAPPPVADPAAQCKTDSVRA